MLHLCRVNRPQSRALLLAGRQHETALARGEDACNRRWHCTCERCRSRGSTGIFGSRVKYTADTKGTFARTGNPPTAVAVPTHFYKVVLAENESGSDSKRPRYAVAAFAIPNRPIEPSTPLTSFVVPLDFLESLTGIEFFPSLLTAERRIAVDAAAAGVPSPISANFFMWHVGTFAGPAVQRACGSFRRTCWDHRRAVRPKYWHSNATFACQRATSACLEAACYHFWQRGAGSRYWKACPHLLADWRKLGLAHKQALMTQGLEQPGDSLPGSTTVVPSGRLPPSSELEQVSTDRGPTAFRPRRTRQGNHGTAHLCELVSCRLPRERFWVNTQALPPGERSKSSPLP